MIAEDQHALARPGPEFLLEVGTAPGIEMGDVAEADQRVAGRNGAPPAREQLAVHVRDVGDRPVEGLPLVRRRRRGETCPAASSASHRSRDVGRNGHFSLVSARIIRTTFRATMGAVM